MERWKRKFNRLSCAAAAVGAVFVCLQVISLKSCNPSLVWEGVKVTPASIVVMRGGDTQFQATVNGDAKSPVVWKIQEETEKSTNTAISTKGLLTVAKDEKLSSLTVRAESKGDETLFALAAVTVTTASISLFNLSSERGVGVGWEWSAPTLTVKNNANLTIYGSSARAKVKLKGKSTVMLSSASIELNDGCPFALEEGADVTLDLAGESAFTAGGPYAGIYVPEGASLTITSSAIATSPVITVKGGKYSAGIGGSNCVNAGHITIGAGWITAFGGAGDTTAGGSLDMDMDGTYMGGGAGIGGGGYLSEGGTIKIEGGTVTAAGGLGSAGIGGAFNGSGGIIEISGGRVTAYGDTKIVYDGDSYGGYGIGGGYMGSGGSITVTDGAIVFAQSSAYAAGALSTPPGIGGTSGDFNGGAFPAGNPYTYP